jgi:hypothetical protein
MNVLKVTASTEWGFDSPTAFKREKYQNLTSNMDALRRITPNGGAYQVIRASDRNDDDTYHVIIAE